MMIKKYALIFILLLACVGIRGQSNVDKSRKNAITAAIEIASHAVASINVTQVRRYSVNPFQRDPWFEYFFSAPDSPERGQRVRFRSRDQS